MSALKPGGGTGGVPTTRTVAGAALSADISTQTIVTAIKTPIGSGTYAARPGSPVLGQTYLVTSGQRMGSLYDCKVAGRWSLVDVQSGLNESIYYDVENLPASGSCRWWAPVRADRVAVPATPLSSYAGPWVLTGSLGGMSCLAFGSTIAESNTFLRAEGLPLGLSGDKSFGVVVSAWNTAVNNGPGALAPGGTTTGSVGLFTCFPGSGYTDVCAEYDGSITSIYRSGNAVTVGTAVHTIVWTWDSGASTSRLYIDGSPASTPTQVPGSTRGQLGRQATLLIGAGRSSLAGSYDGKLHGVALWESRLSNADVSAFHTFHAARFA